jgi:hypothetical protein
MKQLFLAVVLITLVSCKDSKKHDVKTDTVNQDIEISEENLDEETSDIYSNAWINDIKLNEGNKWEANVETNEGILKMQKTIKTQSINTLEDYHQLAEKLESDKNYVLKNCTMKGASHDNLHVWLLPLMKKIDALSETKTIEDATKLKRSIEENINGYADYFE